MSASAGVPPAALVVAAAARRAAREADCGGKASISVRSSLQWAEGTTSATIKRTTLSYTTYLGYIKYPTYPVQCSKLTAVFSGLEWNFLDHFEKILFFWKNLWNDSSDTCDNLHICCKRYWICRFYWYLQCFLVTLRWSFDLPFFALELLHAKKKLSGTQFFMQIVKDHYTWITNWHWWKKNDELSFENMV